MPSYQSCASRRLMPVALFSAAALLLSGCALETADSTLPADIPAGLHGTAMGGQQPVTGATINLVALGTTGYGTPTSVIATTTSGTGGSFTMPSYTCPTPTTPTLLEAVGGNPGLTSGTNNTAIQLVVVSGPCGQLSSSSFFIIDEVTTVAAAYTMRPFWNLAKIGVSSTNALGMTNAQLTAGMLANPSTGVSPGAGLSAGTAIPTTTIHALANSLAACVNTTGPTSTQCTNLFGYVSINPSGANATVWYAALTIASNPATDVSSIYNLAPPASPFQPTLSSSPGDWTLNIVYTPGNLAYAQNALDIDASGNVWVTTVSGFSGTVEEISPFGVPLTVDYLDGYVDHPLGLAIEPSGNIVVASATSGDSSLIRFTPGHTMLYYDTPSSFSTPTGVAIDANNNAIVADPGASKVFLVAPAGTITTSVSETNGPQYPALDGSGNIYVTDKTTYYADRYAGSITGTHTLLSGFTNQPLAATHGSFDSAGDFYAGGYFYENYWAPGATSYTGEGNLGYPHTLTRVDGLGNVWIAGPGYNLWEWSNLLPSEYPGDNRVSSCSPADMGIDRSGNIWCANWTSGGLVEVVGIAAPVTTPLSVAASTNVQGQRP